MLVQRDKNIMIFLEKHRAISTNQATAIFYDGCKRSAVRRLNQLEELKILESYKIGPNKVYKLCEDKEISRHDLYIIDFIAFIYANKGKLLDFKKNPRYFNGALIPDALLKFEIQYEGYQYTLAVLLEIDYTHYTSEIKLNTMYEKLYREEVLKDYWEEEEFPLLVIARPTPGIRYNSKNIEIYYTNLTFDNLLQLVIN